MKVIFVSLILIGFLTASAVGYANVFTYKGKVEESFKAYGVVPNVIPKAPKDLAYVIHANGVEAVLGNEVTPTQVRDAPAVAWNAKSGYFYTLAMIDADVPSRSNNTMSELLHWLVGNIHGLSQQNGPKGDIIAEHVGAAPGPKSGLHRYVFLVYQQPSKLVFNEPPFNNTSAAGRTKFSVANFAKKYDLGDPIAGNFYQAGYDDSVPLLRSQLGDDSLLPCLSGEITCD